MPCLTSWLGPRPHPEERVRRKGAAGSNGRARVSKDEDEPAYSPSCFETHRSALWVWRQLHSRRAATLLSMRGEERGRRMWPTEATSHAREVARVESNLHV